MPIQAKLSGNLGTFEKKVYRVRRESWWWEWGVDWRDKKEVELNQNLLYAYIRLLNNRNIVT